MNPLEEIFLKDSLNSLAISKFSSDQASPIPAFFDNQYAKTIRDSFVDTHIKELK